VRFLVDENLSPLLAASLRDAGHDAVHVRDLGMAHDDDVTVLAYARTDDRVLVTADTDFGGLLAGSGEHLPSVILLRRLQGRRAAVQAQHLLEHLEDLEVDLEAGSVVAFEDVRLRVRRLPI
jgi:predicted nuclease of predicted toxin-antitoxin system